MAQIGPLAAPPPEALAPAIPAVEHGRQRVALPPPRREIQPEEPILNLCGVERLYLSDGPAGIPETREVLQAESGLTCLLVKKLASAIYGEVWEAHEVDIHPEGYFTVRRDENGMARLLAVKRMTWEDIVTKRRRYMEDPIREISTLTRLSDPGHANVLRRVDALDDGTTAYLVTPFIRGGEMFDWVHQERGLPEEVVKPLFRQIVEGMEYMHSHGVCHADMSLENVLVDHTRSNAFIIDFGMSLLMPMNQEGLRMMSVSDRRMAKSSYCPPEMFKKKAYDGVKVDVFTGGAMLFILLTGLPPFTAATRADANFKRIVWRGDVQGLLTSWRVPTLSAEAADLVKQMMTYKAEDRPLPQEVLQHAWFA